MVTITRKLRIAGIQKRETTDEGFDRNVEVLLVSFREVLLIQNFGVFKARLLSLQMMTYPLKNDSLNNSSSFLTLLFEVSR